MEAALVVVIPGFVATTVTAGIGHAVKVEGARPPGPAMPHDIVLLAARRVPAVNSTVCRLLRHVPCGFSKLRASASRAVSGFGRAPGEAGSGDKGGYRCKSAWQSHVSLSSEVHEYAPTNSEHGADIRQSLSLAQIWMTCATCGRARRDCLAERANAANAD